MPNLQGTSPVGRGREGHSYAAPKVSRSGGEEGWRQMAPDGRVYSGAIVRPGGEQAGTTCGV